MANLKCAHCGYENEPERVYCHNCGEKLDRSLLPAVEEEKTESVEKTRKRIRKMTNPTAGGSLRGEIKTLFNVLIYAVIAAALILIARRPDGVPPPVTEFGSRLIASEMQDLVESPQPQQLSFTQEEINLHFKQSLKSKAGAIPGIRFERAYVNLHPGKVFIGTEQSLWSFPIFSGIAYRLEVKDGKFVPTVVGGSFGRLAVAPIAMQYLDWAFNNLWAALKRERGQMDKLGAIQIEEGRVTLTSKGAAP